MTTIELPFSMEFRLNQTTKLPSEYKCCLTQTPKTTLKWLALSLACQL